MIIAVIGGGAAGFFAALSAKKRFPQHQVIILEKTSRVLAKVKISGGGRCNVTNACFDNRELSKFYPRGENYLRKAFETFNTRSTIDWFESRGVKMKTYPDNCIFPLANDSQVIIDCFLKEAASLGVVIRLNHSVEKVNSLDGKFELKGRDFELIADRIIVTTGGQPKSSGLKWLEALGHEIIEPVPSLFTFNMPGNPICELMGNVVEQATVRIEGNKLLGKGPLLITHWGMSGPAILQLSAWGARLLHDKQYNFGILVNWLNELKENDVQNLINRTKKEHGGKMIINLNPFPFTNRLWEHLIIRSDIHKEIRWQDLSKRQENKLINTLLNDRFEVKGKTTFKEEFVTAGGISLKDVDFKTMESKKIAGMHFAGEILDIDGITGGFNFQAAWTTGFIAGNNCGNDPL